MTYNYVLYIRNNQFINWITVFIESMRRVTWALCNKKAFNERVFWQVVHHCLHAHTQRRKTWCPWGYWQSNIGRLQRVSDECGRLLHLNCWSWRVFLASLAWAPLTHPVLDPSSLLDHRCVGQPPLHLTSPSPRPSGHLTLASFPRDYHPVGEARRTLASYHMYPVTLSPTDTYLRKS